MPGHGFSCTRQDPCATTKTQAEISQIGIRRYRIKKCDCCSAIFTFSQFCFLYVLWILDACGQLNSFPMYLLFQRGCHEDSSLEGDFCRHAHLWTWPSVSSHLLQQSKRRMSQKNPTYFEKVRGVNCFDKDYSKCTRFMGQKCYKRADFFYYSWFTYLSIYLCVPTNCISSRLCKIVSKL